MRLVLVEWRDSFGCSTSWERIPVPFSPPPVLLCRSVGWLAYDGPDSKVVVPHVAGTAEERQGCGDMTIPAAAVVRIVDLLETPCGEDVTE